MEIKLKKHCPKSWQRWNWQHERVWWSFNHPHILPYWQNRLVKASSSDRRMWRSKGGGEVGGRERVKLKGQLYLLRTGQTQQHRFGIFFYGSPKRDALIWCGLVCACAYVCKTRFCVHVSKCFHAWCWMMMKKQTFDIHSRRGFHGAHFGNTRPILSKQSSYRFYRQLPQFANILMKNMLG